MSMPPNTPGQYPLNRFFLLSLLLFPGLCSCLLSPQNFDEKAWRLRVEQQAPAALYAVHERDGRYFNPWLEMEKGRFEEFLRWRLTRRTVYSEEQESYLPEVQGDVLARIQKLPAEQDLLIWIGHGTFLLRLSGGYYLTDPILTERALLPKRRTPPALTLDELNLLATPLTVIISHNHYDHLDAPTLTALPDHTRFIVPRGLGELVSSLHHGEVTEIDWWEEIKSGSVLITGLPAQHWSRRIGQGFNRTLWASYLIESSTLKLYFGADSGYFVGYREFGRKYGPIDYALLPITAYHPRWFMHYAHVNVDEALRAFDDLRATHFVPTQWGTFRLGDNPPGYPMLDLKSQINSRGLDPQRVLTPDLGEIILLGPPTEALR
jgi:L-ascorbate metabolism protein UlaG (beta-lactamase superfamily)